MLWPHDYICCLCKVVYITLFSVCPTLSHWLCISSRSDSGAPLFGHCLLVLFILSIPVKIWIQIIHVFYSRSPWISCSYWCLQSWTFHIKYVIKITINQDVTNMYLLSCAALSHPPAEVPGLLLFCCIWHRCKLDYTLYCPFKNLFAPKISSFPVF